MEIWCTPGRHSLPLLVQYPSESRSEALGNCAMHLPMSTRARHAHLVPRPFWQEQCRLVAGLAAIWLPCL